jgi:lipid-A-disaccharide synthase
LVLTVFPFEAPILQKEQIPVRFVGHPLADMLPLVSEQGAARECLNLPQGACVIALLPGSRRGVISNTAELYVKTAQRVSRQLPHAIFVAALVSEQTKAQFARALKKSRAEDLPCRLIVGKTQDVMSASDAILVTAGTASLEAALIKRPMVITYRLSRLSYWTLRNKIRGPHIGLPNILAGREVVPELIQDEATPEKLADALMKALNDKNNAQQLTRVFTELHRELRQGSSDQAAAAVMELVNG